MASEPAETEQLLERVRQGERAAFEELFERYRAPLRHAVALRLDRRLAARVDASDVVQETYLEAARRLPEYLQRPPMPFHLWLRWLARDKVLAVHRQHVVADRRSVGREVPALPIDSSAQFARAMLGQGPTPSQAVAAAELAERLRAALQRMDDNDRELILWRHFDQLSIADTAQLLAISPAAASKRYVRALERLRTLLVTLGVSSAG